MLKDKTALIIEDDAHSLLTLGSLLDEYGIQYKRNTTGASVLEQVHRLQPDVILLDMSLPGGDPFSIQTTLQKDPTLNSIPTIAMLDDEEEEGSLLQAIQSANFAGSITKPIESRMFVDLLQRLLESR